VHWNHQVDEENSTRGRWRRAGPLALAALVLGIVVVALAQQGLVPLQAGGDGVDETPAVDGGGAESEGGAGGPEVARADEAEEGAAPGAGVGDIDGAARMAAAGVVGGGVMGAESGVEPGTGDGSIADGNGTGLGSPPPVRRPVGEDVFPSERAPLVPKPAAVRGIYLNAWAAASPRKRAQLIRLADETEINTFVIDVKEGGEVSYRSGVALARSIGADRGYIRDVREMLAELREHGIYPIARIVVFKDPILAEARPEWAIQNADGSIWRDNKGKLWVDPYNRAIWDYNIALAREAVLLGFSEVQWDYVRFPDVPRRYMETAVYPAQEGRSREDAIREFLRYSREQLADLGVPVTADVFGLTVSVQDDMGIGQRWERMVDATDALLPMVYPSHFAKGSYGIPVPNADPYQTVRKAMEFAIRRTQGVENAAAIRPWLQDFSLGWPSYGAAEVRAQIQAVYDAGLEEWILWNPGSRYTAAALAPEGGDPPNLPIPRHIPRAVAADSLPKPTGDLAEPKVLGEPVRLDSIKPDSVSAPRDPGRRSP